MNRRLREFSRWHVEKHLLSLFLRPGANGVRSLRVADALLPADWVTADWICYCAGVGEDIRIERYLADTCGARVWAFDPTPRSIRYIEGLSDRPKRLQFLPVGLWNEDKVLRFNAPENPAWVSHSVTEDLGGEGFFEAPCRSIPSMMKELNHDSIDLLKMNIEGAEDVVLDAAWAAGVRPRVIALTYEGDSAIAKARLWTALLLRSGYRVLGRLGWFVTYVREA